MGVVMKKSIAIFLSLLLGAGFCFAKKKDAKAVLNAKPVQLGSVLQPLSTTAMETAEISAYMPQAKSLFVVAGIKKMESLDLTDPVHPKKGVAVTLLGNGSSVTANGDLLAVSSLGERDCDTGFVEIFKVDPPKEGKLLAIKKMAEFRPCSQPDMITFTPDGKKLLVACEASPSPDFSEDPAGGIAILTLPENAPAVSAADFAKSMKLNVLGFESLDSTALMKAGVRRVGVSPFYKTLEPEYITVSEDSRVAWVSLQENNAMARVDVAAEKITDVFALGKSDHSKPGFAMDVKSDGEINIENVPVRGLRQPDGISNVTVGGKNYVFTANEGAPVNDYKEWTDETSVPMIAEQGSLDPKVFDATTLSKLQNLTVSRIDACPEVKGGGCPYVTSFGTRSMSIFDGTSGKLLWDSGDQLEQAISKIAPDFFNWNSKKGKLKKDARSADKGCEPENVTVGKVGDKRYAFVGLERTSGVAVFDVSDMNAPRLVDYYLDVKDRGPEGILFVPAEKSPLAGAALLIVGYEYSKTLTIYTVK